MASGPITSWQIDGETMETVIDFIFLGSKITADGDCSHEIKRQLLFGRKTMTNLDSILKSRHYFANKGPYSQSCGFSSSHARMWELDNKKDWELKNWSFWLWSWGRLLAVPLIARRSNQSILKEINPKYSLKWIMLTLNLQYFGHKLNSADSWEKTLPDDGKIEGKRRRGWQRMRWLNGIADSMVEKEMATHSNIPTWEIWWTEERGGLLPMRSQRVRHDWATEYQHTPTQWMWV